jgi:hypothetical protein
MTMSYQACNGRRTSTFYSVDICIMHMHCGAGELGQYASRSTRCPCSLFVTAATTTTTTTTTISSSSSSSSEAPPPPPPPPLCVSVNSIEKETEMLQLFTSPPPPPLLHHSSTMFGVVDDVLPSHAPWMTP